MLLTRSLYRQRQPRVIYDSYSSSALQVMFLAPSELAHIEELFERSLHLQAWHAALQISALDRWEGTYARLLAGRIASALGAQKLGRKFHFSAYRKDKKDWGARLCYARLLLQSRGPIETWQFLRKYDTDPTLAASDPQVHSDWLAFHTQVLGQLRDFDNAEQWMANAEKIGPTNNWLWVERAELFELQDRYEDALGVLRFALMKNPQFYPAISKAAHLLSLMGNDEEALRLLASASQRFECAALVEQLAQLQIELGRYNEARQSWERFAALSPLLEPQATRWLHSQRAEAAYLSGDYGAAVQYAQQSDSLLLQATARKLQTGNVQGKRVVLPVNFVRQHHLTCAPATLAMISQYYKMPAQHLEIAEEICYDGTCAHSQRNWALRNGYAVREFSVIWDDAVALLNRGVVFALGTVDPGSAHLQAVIGYDNLRETFIVRDPNQRQTHEIEAAPFLQKYRACGPRGMAMVPKTHANIFDSLTLTDEKAYDELYAVEEALKNNDRTTAQKLWRAMESEFGATRLTWQAKLALAAYDNNHVHMLDCYEHLLGLYPEDVNFKLCKLACLKVLERRNEQFNYLRGLCKDKTTNTMLWHAYAHELHADARQIPYALHLARKVLRQQPHEADNIHLLAEILWQQKHRAQAFELYRFAACLNDKNEQFAHSYFSAAFYLNQADTALASLRDRVHRFGAKSGLPARTLFTTLEQLGKRTDAIEVLKQGVALRPDDAELRLYLAETYARYGNFDQATSLLNEAQAKAANNIWLRTAATIADYQGQLSEALLHWLQVVDAEPLALDANRHAAKLLAETEGPRAAIEYLRDRTNSFPHSTALRQLLVEWLAQDQAAVEKELRQLLEIDPTNDWAERRLALILSEKNWQDDALAACIQACQIDPANPENHFVRGQILLRAGKTAEAKVAYATALQLSADHSPSIVGLMSASTTLQERHESLRFIWQELMRQTIQGDGLLSFREMARETLSAHELLEQLYEALRLRPDLPQSWSVVIAQSIEVHQLVEALSLALKASERFPLAPRSWFDLALAHEANLNFPSQIEALQRTLSISPSWMPAVQKLADAYDRTGKLRQARNLLEQAISFAPLSAHMHGYLANVLWKMGEKEQAITVVQKALSLQPDYDWAWRSLSHWGEELMRPTLGEDCACALTERRPGDPRAWLTLAKMTSGEEKIAQKLTALERAIQLHPTFIEAHSTRTFLLADAGCYDEALAAARPPIFGRDLPPELRTAEAYVEAQRGDVQKALKKMRAALQEEPNYAPGWERLARWCRTLEYPDEYLEAAKNLVRLMPHYAVALGYLGEAKLWLRDRDGAKECYQRALTLAPDYDFVGFALFDLYLEENNLRGAESTLEILQQHVNSNATKLRALRYAAKRNNSDLAHAHFYDLCLATELATEYLDKAFTAMTEARLGRTIDVVLENALDKSTVNPYVGSLWIRRHAEQKRLGECVARLDWMVRQGATSLWHCAAREYLEACVQMNLAEQVKTFVKRYGRSLQSETQSWGVAGSALYKIGDLQGTADWMLEWEERRDATSWMLWSLALALRALGREENAHYVSNYAITLPPDHCTCSHLALLSLDEVLAGKLEDAAQHAARVTPQSLTEWDQVTFALSAELRSFYQARAEGRSIAQNVIDQLLRLAQQVPWLKTNEILVNLFKRSIENVLHTENDSILKLKTKVKMKWFDFRTNH